MRSSAPAAESVTNLPKDRRLATPADYRRVYQSRHWGSSEHYSFNALAAERRAIGVTVSKKVAKSAVTRNRIKRQIKEFYRLHQDGLSATELVITARPSCANASDKERLDSLTALWDKYQKWQQWYDRKHRPHSATLNDQAIPQKCLK